MGKITQATLLASALLLGLSAPAMADWVRIGGVDVSHGRDRDTAYSRFGGGVDRLRLDVRDSDVTCRSVRATFANGRSREVFKGNLRSGRAHVIELPGDDARVRKLDFNCRASARRGATITISAEVNRYRDEWRRSPDWDRQWSRLFNWGPVVDGPGMVGPGPRPGPGHGRPDGDRGRWRANDWVSVGTASFGPRGDRRHIDAGWAGRRVDRVALQALNADAQCRNVHIRFSNGERFELDLGRGGDRLRQGNPRSYDLPGGRRNISAMSLDCSSQDRQAARIEVLTNK